MKRFILGVCCVIATAIPVLAQAQKDSLATLIQAGNHKAALAKIQAGADVNEAQPDGTTPVLWAVVRADHDLLDALIAKQAKVDVTNQFGSTPLTEAAKLGDARMVKALLAAGAKVDSANQDGETALMVAIKTGDLATVETLVAAGANVNNIEKFHDQTPLMYAASGNKPEIVKLLLSKGASVKPRALYSDWPSQITSEPRWQFRSVGGLDALLYAARSGCSQCAEQLIQAGADVNMPTPEGVTPLMIALDNSNNEVAKLLMDKGAKLDVWDWWGRTPLWIAVDRKAVGGGGPGGGGPGGRGGPGAGAGRGGQGPGGAPGPGAPLGGGARGAARAPTVSSMDIIRALLDAGVNPNPEMNFHRPNAPGRGRFQDNQISTGTTPLFRAVQNNDLEVIRALLEKGANPNLNTMSYSAFLLAAGVGAGGRGGGGGGQANTELLDLMTQHFADVNAQVTGTKLYSYNISRAAAPNNEGMTALHAAAQSGNLNMVKYLLDKGANPNILDANGKKPIDLVGVRAGGPGGAPGAAPAKPAAAAGAPTPLAGAGGGRAGGAAGPSPATLAEIRTLLQDAAAKK